MSRCISSPYPKLHTGGQPAIALTGPHAQWPSRNHGRPTYPIRLRRRLRNGGPRGPRPRRGRQCGVGALVGVGGVHQHRLVQQLTLGDDTASAVPLSEDMSLADGEIPDGVTVFDNEYPAVANLDHALLVALRKAATNAAMANVDLVVNSGWRSPRYQEQLLKEAVAKYGSTKAAARWVATPTTSPHVFGDAVDIGPSNAEAWLSRHGAHYGLCQIYTNEPWHYACVSRR